MVGKIGYKRVSTAQQKHDRQLDGIALDKEYVEIKLQDLKLIDLSLMRCWIT